MSRRMNYNSNQNILDFYNRHCYYHEALEIVHSAIFIRP